MRTHFQRDLDQMQQHILDLAALVEKAIHQTIDALQTRQPSLAQEVIEGDETIDQEENFVEEECLKMLALHQPVAVDLRRIIAVLKINGDLERMADLCVNIAERVLTLGSIPTLPFPGRLQKMADLTTTMVRYSLDAFMKQDAGLARRVIKLDDEVDRYNKEIIDELIALMKASPELVTQGLSVFSAVRHLERIADHATNIAEDVVYLIEGEIIRHRPPEAAASPFSLNHDHVFQAHGWQHFADTVLGELLDMVGVGQTTQNDALRFQLDGQVADAAAGAKGHP
jgi:phosphate transport system protein